MSSVTTVFVYMKHRSGKMNGNADALCQVPVQLRQDVSGEGRRSVRDWTCYISGELLLAGLYVLSFCFIYMFRMCVVLNYFL